MWVSAAAAAAKSLQSCPTLCDSIDGSPPGSPVPGILKARTLEWVAISFSSEWKWKVKVKSLSCARLLATPWTAAYQAPPSIGFCRQAYWSGVPLSEFSSIQLLTHVWLFVPPWIAACQASASPSVLPMYIQDWFPLGLTDLLSLLSSDSQESFPTPQFKNINSSKLSFPYGPTVTSIHDYWKNRSFDYTGLCWQSNVSAF